MPEKTMPDEKSDRDIAEYFIASKGGASQVV
jgi:hypothetical protein